VTRKRFVPAGSLFFVIILSSSIVPSYAEGIPITISGTMNKVSFDGKWSFATEWKESTLTQIDTGAEPIYLRTAHQGDYIYVLIDAVEDTHFVKGSDSAIVCIDGSNDKEKIPNTSDYCFVATLGEKSSFTLQGGSPLGINGNFRKIPNPEDFIGISSVSDQNDRYSTVPHASYEFRIPINLFGRSDVYGFYTSVYFGHANKFYSFPSTSTPSSLFEIPPPATWGEIVSPDKSLPEFSWPTVLLLSGVLFVIYFTKMRSGHLQLRTNGN